MPEHEFPGGAARCIYCGTLATQHERKACPGPQVRRGEKLLPPLPDKQREYAANEVDVIHARLAELEAERAAVRNLPPDEEGQALGVPVEEGGVQH